MTTIRSAPPRIASTSSTSSAAAPATAKSASAATGSSTASSFQAATGSSGGGIRATLDAGKKVCEDIGGSSADTLKAMLDKPIPSQKDLEKIMDAYGEIMGDLDDGQRKTLEKAIGFQMMGRTLSDQFRQMCEKFAMNPSGR